MLSGPTQEAISWGERALRRGARSRQSRSGIARAEQHRYRAAGPRATWWRDGPGSSESLDIALADGLEEHAARAWTNIGSLQAKKRMLADAEQTLRTGITYCAGKRSRLLVAVHAGMAGRGAARTGPHRGRRAAGRDSPAAPAPLPGQPDRCVAGHRSWRRSGVATRQRRRTRRAARDGQRYRGAAADSAGRPAAGRGGVDRRTGRRHRRAHRRGLGRLRRRGGGAVAVGRVGLLAGHWAERSTISRSSCQSRSR